MNTGWVCPKCGKVYAPHISGCLPCNMEPVKAHFHFGLDLDQRAAGNRDREQSGPAEALKPLGTNGEIEPVGACVDELVCNMQERPSAYQPSKPPPKRAWVPPAAAKCVGMAADFAAKHHVPRCDHDYQFVRHSPTVGHVFRCVKCGDERDDGRHE